MQVSLWFYDFLYQFVSSSLVCWNIKLYRFFVRVIRVIDSKRWGRGFRLEVGLQILIAGFRLLILLLHLLWHLYNIRYKAESRLFKPSIVMIPAVPLVGYRRQYI